MAFEDDIIRHAEQVKTRLPHTRGHDATKQALVIPLLQVLGYDVCDAREVQPGYVAELASKKSGPREKIDYAIHLNGHPCVFVACGAADVELAVHDAKLARYFDATPSVRVAILTNGVRIKVFADLERPDMMDAMPWMDIDLRKVSCADLMVLKSLRKTNLAAEHAFDAFALALSGIVLAKGVGANPHRRRRPAQALHA